jgi:hypothetical protein
VASWALLTEQVVWISPLATGFTVVCERCVEGQEPFPSVQGTLTLDRVRGSIECPHGHTLRIERDGR